MEYMPKARAAALRALEIDPELAEAHTSLASIAQNYDWDWQTAEKEYRRAIQLDPNYATAHHWFAECLALQGKFDQAFAEISRARQLDPLSLIMASDHGVMLYFSRQYDRANDQFRAVLEVDPNFGRAHMSIFAYVQKGQFAESSAEIEKWRKNDDNSWIPVLQAYVDGRSGNLAQAREALQKLEQLRPPQAYAMQRAVVYIGLGNKDAAITALQEAYADHISALTALKVDPTYDPLRDDPRFQELLGRIHLAQ